MNLKAAVKGLLTPRQVCRIDRCLARAAFVQRFGLRLYRMSVFKSIEGFLLDEEAVCLYEIGNALPNKPVVVEIGSWLGKSSVVLGNALAFKEEARLICIDPFDASGDSRSALRYDFDSRRLQRPLREIFEENLARAGVRSVVTTLQGYSEDLVKSWRTSIDMLFIDGNHEFAAVKQDFLDWMPFIKYGGIVAFHDTYFSPPQATVDGQYHAGPGRVVQEHVLGSSSWATICHVGSLFVSKKVLSN
jgi:MMP 1-O-methyltransferase